MSLGGRALLIGVAFVAVTMLGAGVASSQGSGLRFIEEEVSAELEEAPRVENPVGDGQSPTETPATGTTLVRIANDTAEEAGVTFSVVSNEEDGEADVTVTSPDLCTVAALDVGVCEVEFQLSGADTFEGSLVGTAQASGAIPAVSALTLSPKRDLATAALAILLGSLAFAVILVLVRRLRLPKAKRKFSGKMGPVNWKFSDSWASSLTAVGALLGTVLAGKLLPENPVYVSEVRFTALNLFFGALVVIAPFVYAAFREPKKPYPARDKEPLYLGRVGVFFIATAITLWAVTGELATLGLALAEVAQGPLGTTALIVPSIVLVATFACVCVYAWNTIFWTVDAQFADRVRGISRKKATEIAVKIEKATPDLSLSEDEMEGLAEALSTGPSTASWSPM